MTKRKTAAGKGKVEGGGALQAPSGFRPFADDETAVTIGGMTIENGTDRVSISGALDIAADRAGVEAAQALKRAVDAIVDALAARGDLPEEAGAGTAAQDTPAPKRVRNPFA